MRGRTVKKGQSAGYSGIRERFLEAGFLTLDLIRVGIDILIYARSSTDEQDRSCDTQVRGAVSELRAEGLLKGMKLPSDHSPAHGVYVDEGCSGWKYGIDERPAAKAMLEFCRANPRPKHRPGVILVWSLSRFGRFRHGPEEAIYWLYEFRRQGWWVRSLTQPGLDSPDEDRLMRVIRTALESDKDTSASEEKADVVKRGKQSAVEKGYWAGGPAPFGFERWACRRDPNNNVEWIEALPPGKRNAYQDAFTLLRPEVSTAEWSQAIFRLYGDGDSGECLSMAEIGRRLQQQGISTPQAGEGWGHTIISKILKNPAYIGIQQTADSESHRALWEPLVDREVWDRVQARLDREPLRGKAANSAFTFSGLVTCMECGAVLWGEKNRSGSGFRYYYRPKRDLTGTRACGSCRRVPVESLEAPVIDAIASAADHPIVLGAVCEEERALLSGAQTVQTRIAKIDGEILEAKQQIGRMLELAGSGGIAGEMVKERLIGLNQSIERLQTERAKLEAGRTAPGKFSKFAADARGFRHVYALATPAERRDLVRALDVRIVVDATRRRAQVRFLHPTG